MIELKTLEPIARKEHKCMYCGGAIKKGEKYERGTYLNDGYIYDWIAHISCTDLASELNMWDNVDGGLSEDDFREFINDKYAEIMSDNYNDIWESEEFIMPDFLDKVEFLKEYFKLI